MRNLLVTLTIALLLALTACGREETFISYCSDRSTGATYAPVNGSCNR